MARRWLDRVARRRPPAGPPIPPSEPPDPPDDFDDEDDGVPMVPFVPVRCPRCAAAKPKTTGAFERRDGKIRYHICQECDQRFRSVELDPQGLAE